MKCPVCKDVDLKEVMTRNGVLVDWCPKCEGIWLDKGELEKIQAFSEKWEDVKDEPNREKG